jgi:hypothetical protein
MRRPVILHCSSSLRAVMGASQYSGEIDLSEAAYQVLAKLQGYGVMLGNAVKSLNTVRRKGKEREEGGE